MKCRDCKWIRKEDADEDIKHWGINEMCFCKLYSNFVADFGSSHVSLSKRLYVAEDQERICNHFAKK